MLEVGKFYFEPEQGYRILVLDIDTIHKKLDYIYISSSEEVIGISSDVGFKSSDYTPVHFIKAFHNPYKIMHSCIIEIFEEWAIT